MIKLLGKGSYGTVYMVADENYSLWALKVPKCRRQPEIFPGEILTIFFEEQKKEKEKEKETNTILSPVHPWLVQAICQSHFVTSSNPSTPISKRPSTILNLYSGNLNSIPLNFLNNQLYCQIFKGLADLHFSGLVHGDIKPSNIFWKFVVADGENEKEEKSNNLRIAIVFGDLDSVKAKETVQDPSDFANISPFYHEIDDWHALAISIFMIECEKKEKKSKELCAQMAHLPLDTSDLSNRNRWLMKIIVAIRREKTPNHLTNSLENWQNFTKKYEINIKSLNNLNYLPIYHPIRQIAEEIPLPRDSLTIRHFKKDPQNDLLKISWNFLNNLEEDPILSDILQKIQEIEKESRDLIGISSLSKHKSLAISVEINSEISQNQTITGIYFLHYLFFLFFKESFLNFLEQEVMMNESAKETPLPAECSLVWQPRSTLKTMKTWKLSFQYLKNYFKFYKKLFQINLSLSQDCSQRDFNNFLHLLGEVLPTLSQEILALHIF